eukprot:6176998-Pleurochrysis_carterae.AAC.1
MERGSRHAQHGGEAAIAVGMAASMTETQATRSAREAMQRESCQEPSLHAQYDGEAAIAVRMAGAPVAETQATRSAREAMERDTQPKAAHTATDAFELASISRRRLLCAPVNGEDMDAAVPPDSRVRQQAEA